MLDVQDAQFFHINSNANASPYDLMQPGFTLKIGAESNPFFRFYETYARTYPLRLQNGATQNISALSFLKGVKNGSMNPDNLPAVAHEVSQHFMMLARELVWENVRIKDFSILPSRQRCL